MTLVSDFSIVGLILSSSILAKIILGILLVLSMISWYVMVIKFVNLYDTERAIKSFLTDFWSTKDLQVFYNRTKDNPQYKKPDANLYRIFEVGLFAYLQNNKAVHNTTIHDARDIMSLSEQAMYNAQEKQREGFEKHLSFLATVGSVSPYIGLLGTVLGIMNAFINLGSAQTTTLISVAPGIAEALIATACGLFAAIPALIAYNHFVQKIERIERTISSFIGEFSQILHQHLMTQSS